MCRVFCKSWGSNALVTCYQLEHTANGRGVFWHGRHVHRHFFPLADGVLWALVFVGMVLAPTTSGSGMSTDRCCCWSCDTKLLFGCAIDHTLGCYGVFGVSRLGLQPQWPAFLGNWDRAQETLDSVRTQLQTTNVGVPCLDCHHHAPSTLVGLVMGLLARLSHRP